MIHSRKKAPQRRWRQWREADAREALAAWKQSGLSLEAFAQSRGLSLSRLLRWKKRLAVGEPVRFVAVERPALPGAMMEIAVRGILLRVREDLPAQDLHRLVAAVIAALPPC